MTNALTAQLAAALAQFSSTSRLYELKLEGSDARRGTGSLLVEAFLANDVVDGIGVRDVIVLSTSVHVDLTYFLGQQACLAISLADGTRIHFSGEISELAQLGSDGGFARYRVRISPWLWRLGQVRNCRVWQEKTVIEIVDSVFESYLPLARWRWSEDTSSFMADVRPRSYCCQYRESDLDFVRRLLAEEGLSWRFEHVDDGANMVLFADSSQPSAVPEDRSSKLDGGLRYHGVSAVERQDTVQALVAQRRLHVSLSTVISYDYKAKQVVAGSSPSRVPAGPGLSSLEAFDFPGQYTYADIRQAQRYADLQMEGKEARGQTWHGRSTVRTLQAGTRMRVTGTPRRALGQAPEFTILRVVSVGVNNLPPPARQALAELFGPVPELLWESTCLDMPKDIALVIERAVKSGYANCFDAIPAALPWRPQLPGSDGRSHPKPTAFGTQSAIVIGPDGSAEPNGADELYCDRLGRVRIRFHWQDSDGASCWVRVAQRLAGGGMGSQFLPRIGQEVLVQFLENDIDRPIIVGALYNGRGEGGIAPTPGGQVGAEGDASLFEYAHDHARSAQGNVAGGNSPVWHGASGARAGHRNMAAQWGIRTKEFGGFGYNQLVFDDTDAQGRVQLKCSHAATELNLGHLIHAVDNYRGSFRGLGVELRTDACGAVRAGSGLLVSSYGIHHAADSRDPVGENAAGIGMLHQAVKLAEAFNSAAVTHKTVGLGAAIGAAEANLSALSGMVEQLPNPGDPLIAILAKDAFAAHAGQSIQIATGETAMLMSGQDTQLVTGGQMRIHAGQSIGVLGGSIRAGAEAVGVQLITSKDAIDIQAQGDGCAVQARDQADVISANAHVDWAAAKRISLSTAGGANITIDGGNITVQCPGKITVHAGKKRFTDPEKLGFDIPVFPRSICIECLRKSLAAGLAFTMVE
nr:type VI secretion system Vgr family protein [Massilia sp. PDC64]